MAAPAGLGARGRALWADLGGDDAAPAARLLMHEICRTADRLDRLDGMLRRRGAQWVELMDDDGDGVVTVVVDGLLSEARQQQTALKGLMAELRQHHSKVEQPSREEGGSDDLAAKRAERRAAAGL